MCYRVLIILTIIASACGSEEVVEAEDSFLVQHSDKEVSDLVEALKTEIENNDLKVFSVIDHGKAAQEINEDLLPVTVVIFGNPEVGTKLMQCDPRMGIELPLKILVWQGKGNKSHIGFWNTGDYAEYYELDHCKEVLKNINEKLHLIVNNVVSDQ